MTTWFEDPKQLIRADRITEFWPNSSQTPVERINSASRFILYCSAGLYLIRRDLRVFVLAATVLGVLYLMHTSDMVKPAYGRPTYVEDGHDDVQLPTKDNPMGNVLMTDYTDRPNRPSAAWYPSVKPMVNSYMDDTFRFGAARSRTALPEYRKRHAARQFVSVPVTSIPGDTVGFAEWCYGKKNGPSCRGGDSELCSPNMRGVQLEAFGGLNDASDRR